MPISQEQKLEIIDWLATKVESSHVDYWEKDAFAVFPKFFFQFDSEAELDDPFTVLYNAMLANKRFPSH